MRLRVKIIVGTIAALAAWHHAGVSASSAATLDRGHSLLLQHGFQVQALVASTPFGFSDLRWNQSNFTSPLLVGGIGAAEPPTSGGQWSRWLNSAGDAPVRPGEDVSKLVTLQWRDEQSLTSGNIAEAAGQLAQWRTQYPHVIGYTNQSGNQESNATMRTYMLSAQPDMLMFDTYPFGSSLTGGSPRFWYRDLQKFRNLAAGGLDGTGSRSIPYGTYLQTFVVDNHTVSESEVRLNQFGAWTFGAKMATAFYYIDSAAFPSLHSVLFEANSDAAPTATFFQLAETNRQSRNLGPALVRLENIDVRMVMGKHKGGFLNLSDVPNSLPSGVSAWSSSAVPYLTSVSATNLGNKNNGLAGDVIVGEFKPLDAAFASAGHENDTYFMITNGLTDTNGSAADCRQEIQLSFDFGESGINSLLRLSRETGQVELVNLVHQSGSLYTLDLILDGGTGDLFKYNNGGAFLVPEASSMVSLGMGMLGFIRYCRRKRRGGANSQIHRLRRHRQLQDCFHSTEAGHGLR
jgi:hypothetical protein